VNATLAIKRQCTRCPREDEAEVSLDEVVKMARGGKIPDPPKSLVVQMDDKNIVEFSFLCQQCKTIVQRYMSHVMKKPKHQSALRGETKIEVEEDD